MHNPFLLHPRQLRSHWKDLRKSIVDTPDDIHALDAVIKFWSNAPIGKQYLDHLSCQSWPDAWELTESKYFDYSSVSLGMFYTLLLADGRWPADRLALAMIKNEVDCFERIYAS